MEEKIKYVIYRELYFENYLKDVFDRISYEKFELNDPEVHGQEIIRITKPGEESGINVKYIRRLKPKKENFNDFNSVIEKAEFFKGENYSIFVKGQYSLKIKFEGEEPDIIRHIIKDMSKEFSKISKKDMGLIMKVNGDEAKMEFDRSPDIRDEIYIAHKILFNYLISKGL